MTICNETPTGDSMGRHEILVMRRLKLLAITSGYLQKFLPYNDHNIAHNNNVEPYILCNT